MKVALFSSLLFFFGDLERGCRSTKKFGNLLLYSVIQTYVIMRNNFLGVFWEFFKGGFLQERGGFLKRKKGKERERGDKKRPLQAAMA